MLGKILLRTNKRARRIAIIVFCLLFVVILFFPVPITEERLTNRTWCAPSVPFVHWQFAETGEFYYQVFLLDGIGATSVGSGQGIWEIKKAAINVVLDNRNIRNDAYTFTIRPMLWGRLLWTTQSFGEGISIIPIWRTC